MASKVYLGTVERYLSHVDKSIDPPKGNSNSYNWFSYAWKMRCFETGETFNGKEVARLWAEMPEEKKAVFQKAALKTREPKKKKHGKNHIGGYSKFISMLKEEKIVCPVGGINWNTFAGRVWEQIGRDHPKVSEDWLKKDLTTQKKYAREAVRNIKWVAGSSAADDSDSDSSDSGSYGSYSSDSDS